MTTSLEKMIACSLMVPMGDPLANNGCRMGLNLMLWGDPGIGKSDRVESAARSVGLTTHTIFAATCQPEDVAGVPFPNASKGIAMFEGGLSEFAKILEDPFSYEDWPAEGFWKWSRKFIEPLRKSTHRIVRRMVETGLRYGPNLSRLEVSLPGIREAMIDKESVLFIDELSCSRPAVQGSLLSLILARTAAGQVLPNGVRIISAANPPESAAGGWELEPPMANRFCHYNVPTPTVDEWGAWLLNERGESLETIEDSHQKLLSGWNENWPIVKGSVVGFLQAQPTLIHKIPPEGNRSRGMAWPSPRTWSFAARALATGKCLNTDAETIASLITGCIGEGAGDAFNAWLLKADLPHPRDALTKGWVPDTLRLDRTQAVLSSVVAYVISRPSKKERVDLAVPAWQLLNRVVKANHLDLVVDKATTLVAAGLDSTSGSQDIMEAYHPVMLRLAQSGYNKYVKKP